MALEYKFNGRDKLAKGYTYPIKRDDLDAALERAGVTDLDYVSYTCCVKKKDTELILSSTMTGEAFLPGSWHKMSPSIGVFAVPVDLSQQVKNALKKEKVLAQLANWLKKLESAENVRRDHRQSFYAYFKDNRIDIEHT